MASRKHTTAPTTDQTPHGVDPLWEPAPVPPTSENFAVIVGDEQLDDADAADNAGG